MRHLKSLAFLFFFALAAGRAKADFVVPPTGVDSVAPNGTALTLTGGPYDADSVLTLTATGTVNLNVFDGPFIVNAAGVILADGGFYTNPVGSVRIPVGGTTPFGVLEIGNPTLGFHQLFASNAANGLGSGAPPTDLSVSATLGSIFGPGVSIPDGTQLYVRVFDTPRNDNLGSFTVSGILTTTAVPEPSSLALMGLGAAALVGLKARRRKALA